MVGEGENIVIRGWRFEFGEWKILTTDGDAGIRTPLADLVIADAVDGPVGPLDGGGGGDEVYCERERKPRM